jgi:hypothetical protein
VSDLKKLREIYDRQLSVGPFPTAECAVARIAGNLHADLVLYLADIAGLASRGEGLAELDQSTRHSFKHVVAKSFLEKYPECKERITAVDTPKLYQLISTTEQARLLIAGALSR